MKYTNNFIKLATPIVISYGIYYSIYYDISKKNNMDIYNSI